MSNLETNQEVLFCRFRATNAHPFKKLDLNLRNQGLVRMSGPNGAGKSSVWHLFTQACQNTSPNKASKSDLMLDFMEDEFLLEVTFIRNGQTYTAAQALKSSALSPVGEAYGTGAYLFRETQDISKHKDPDTRELIQQTLGWTLEEWYGYVYLAQSTTHALINGTRSTRQNYLSALFNLQPLDKLSAVFKAKAVDLQDQIDLLEKDKQELQIKTQMMGTVSREELQKNLQDLWEVETALAAKEKNLQDEAAKFLARKTLENRIAQAQALVHGELDAATLNVQLEQLQREHADHQAAASLRQTLTRQLGSLAPVHPPQLPERWQEAQTSPDLDEPAERARLLSLEQISRTLVEIPAPEIPEDFEEVLSSHDINRAAVVKQIQEIEARPAPPSVKRPLSESIEAFRQEVQASTNEKAILEADLKKFNFSGAECPTCGTTLNCEDRAQTKVQKEEQLLEVKETLEALATRVKTAERAERLWQDHDALGPDRSSELPELKSSVALFDKKQQYLRLKAAQAAHEVYRQGQAQVQEIEPLKARLALWEVKKACRAFEAAKLAHDAYVAEKARLDEALAAIQPTQDRILDIQRVQGSLQKIQSLEALKVEFAAMSEVEDVTEKLQQLRDQIKASNSERAVLTAEVARIEKLQTEVSKLQESVAARQNLYQNQKRYTLLGKAYGKAGQLRELQLSRFSRYLEEALLTYTIRQLPKHRFKIVVDDGIDILAQKSGGRFYDVKLMSGGEKGDLSVAFLFALDDLLPADRRTNLKIIDEVEAGFDKARQQDFVQFTLPELKKRAETVVVISHSDAANSAAFDRVWEIQDGMVKDVTADARNFEKITEATA